MPATTSSPIPNTIVAPLVALVPGATVAAAPTAVLWREPAGEAGVTFEGVLGVFGYQDRVGDETGQEYRSWVEHAPVEVDTDYDALGQLWELYRVDAEQLAPAAGLSTGQYLDRRLGCTEQV